MYSDGGRRRDTCIQTLMSLVVASFVIAPSCAGIVTNVLAATAVSVVTVAAVIVMVAVIAVAVVVAVAAIIVASIVDKWSVVESCGRINGYRICPACTVGSSPWAHRELSVAVPPHVPFVSWLVIGNVKLKAFSSRILGRAVV